MSDETESEGIFATLTKAIENNWRLLLVGVIILAIALNSSWSNNKTSAENQATPTPQTEQTQSTDQTTQTASNSALTPAPTPATIATPTPAPTPEATVTTTSNGNTVTVVAVRSEGVTHLARKAIKEYLGTAQENLSAEQKIYAEDYLRKKTGTKVLEIGQKVEFSTDLIKQSIEQAKGLNQKQIENLSKYVPLVKI